MPSRERRKSDTAEEERLQPHIRCKIHRWTESRALTRHDNLGKNLKGKPVTRQLWIVKVFLSKAQTPETVMEKPSTFDLKTTMVYVMKDVGKLKDKCGRKFFKLSLSQKPYLIAGDDVLTITFPRLLEVKRGACCYQCSHFTDKGLELSEATCRA